MALKKVAPTQANRTGARGAKPSVLRIVASGSDHVISTTGTPVAWINGSTGDGVITGTEPTIEDQHRLLQVGANTFIR